MTALLFPALLRYWRCRRGHSQLDLSIEAGVSARHIGFLELGRAAPSEEMVLRLLTTLDVPLRDRNDILRAAGFPARYATPQLDAISPAVNAALVRMMRQHEPYPLTVLSADYDILRSNAGATRLFSMFLDSPSTEPAIPHGSRADASLPRVVATNAMTEPFVEKKSVAPTTWNMFSLVFDPGLMRPFIVDWARLAGGMIARLHRESLQRAGDARLAALLQRVLGYPDVPRLWRQPDFSAPNDPVVSILLKRGDLELSFFTTITVFSAPQQVTLEEIRIESSFPLDERTERICERLAVGSSTREEPFLERFAEQSRTNPRGRSHGRRTTPSRRSL